MQFLKFLQTSGAISLCWLIHGSTGQPEAYLTTRLENIFKGTITAKNLDKALT